MTRQSTEVAADLKIAEAALDEAIASVRMLKRELEAAKVAEASDPWLGSIVRRMVEVGYGSKRRDREQRGKVVPYVPHEHRNIRGFYSFSVEPGDPIVLAESGKSAWALKSYGKIDRWEIVE